MVAFVVVAVACAVLVVNAARGSAVDLLRGPLPVVAATKVWHLVPGVEHPERPAGPGLGEPGATRPVAQPRVGEGVEEARRHGDTGLCHLAEARAFAADTGVVRLADGTERKRVFAHG